MTDDVPVGTTARDARGRVKLVMLCKDVSLHEVMRLELQKGFGFFQSKPASAFSPVRVTPDERGGARDGGKLALPLVSTFNGRRFGAPDAGVDLSFDFPTLIARAARTRDLAAGTMTGSGTASNDAQEDVGSSCLVENRMIEITETGSTGIAFMTGRHDSNRDVRSGWPVDLRRDRPEGRRG